MVTQQAFLSDPRLWLMREAPDDPVFFFDPRVLQATAARFQADFPGTVTYAVKANPAACVLDNLVAAGLRAFDVASVPEMVAVRAACPTAALHFHNPVRSQLEIAQGIEHGVTSWSVDRWSELDKLGEIPKRSEVAVRLKLPLTGAAYDFGSKFGADATLAADLLRAVQARGLTPSMTFHPGTQCDAPDLWRAYIRAAADVAKAAGVQLARLNVGGGFASHRAGAAPDLGAVFAAIAETVQHAFGATPPRLVCEPGRAMVAEAFTLALRVKAVSKDAVTLNDGLYGALAEWRDLPASPRITVLRGGRPLPSGERRAFTVFGPTCDSLDRVPDAVPLPSDIAEGDHLLIAGMGAYSRTLGTRFNGYGAERIVTLAAGTGHAKTSL
ncbi:type III PLP-dependent enzyme [Thalassococcus sp. BH17M4-6]|uniref:type III PLP-dependent enzyme n=1 Tax=Thalassococcus sp. BH17M4-6 TaxID=3413148 RepID=UPI003BEAA322